MFLVEVKATFGPYETSKQVQVIVNGFDESIRAVNGHSFTLQSSKVNTIKVRIMTVLDYG